MLNRKYGPRFWMGVIMLGAFLLRVYTLGQKSFWYDEACSLQFSCRPLLSIFQDHYLLRPLYFVLLNLWTHIFGINEFISRLPSVFLGVGTVFFSYKLGAELFNKKVGVLTAFLFASSYFHVAWSQQVRNYSLLVFLCTVASFFYFRYVNKRKMFYCWGYAVFTSLSLFVSPIAGFLFVCQAGFAKVMLSDKKDVAHWWRVVLIVCCPSIVVLLTFVWLMRAYHAEDIVAINTTMSGLQGIWQMLVSFNCGGGYVAQGATENYMGDKLVFPHAILNIVLILCYVWGSVISRGRENNVIFCWIWLWLPVGILSVLKLFAVDFFSVKYMIFALPAYYCCIARGLSAFRWKPLLGVILGLIMVCNIISFREYYNPPHVASWREAGAFLKKNVRPLDIILLVPSQQIAPVWLYYKNDMQDFSLTGNGVNGKVKKVDGVWESQFMNGSNLVMGIPVDGIRAFVDSADIGDSDIWLVSSRDWPGMQDYSLLLTFLNRYRQCVDVRDYTFEGVRIQHYVRAGK